MTGERRRRLGALVLLLGAAWSLPTTYAVHAALPFNPIVLPGRGVFDPQLWVPQGWRFFTRDAQEPDLMAFERRPAGWASALPWPCSRTGNLFGLNRTARARGLEVGLLLTAVGAAAWRECTARPEDCLESIPEPVRLDSPLERPSLCGDIGLVHQRPVPWAWFQAGREITMPSRVVRLWIAC